MKKITDKEYKRYERYKLDEIYGRVLTPDGMRLIIEANNFDAEKIGQHFLEMWPKILEWTKKEYE